VLERGARLAARRTEGTRRGPPPPSPHLCLSLSRKPTSCAHPPSTALPSILPDGGRVLSSGKAVRFEVARAEGVTPNRDWGLLYASPELLRKRE
jgi:hypothetical protein